jgi:hypothetical protein
MAQEVGESTVASKAAQELSRLVTESASIPALERNRTYSLGIAAVALAMLLQILQLSDLDLALRITVVSCAAALPMSVFMVFALEYYLLLGPRSYPHYILFARARVISVVLAIQGVGIGIAAGGVLYHVQPLAMWVFAASSIGALLLIMGVHYNLAEWWFDQRRARRRQQRAR